jgi:hypothetical protein
MKELHYTLLVLLIIAWSVLLSYRIGELNDKIDKLIELNELRK